MIKSISCILFIISSVFFCQTGYSQALQIPNNSINLKCQAGRSIGPTDILIKWNAPGVKGREGKIFGTDVAPFGMNVLGFGSEVPSPWRAGADECTTMHFSTDVIVNGKRLPAGHYAFFVMLGPDTCTLIFNSNIHEWGSYFYEKELDVLRVNTIPVKDITPGKERLEYNFKEQSENSVTILLEWDNWAIPIKVETDLVKNTLASIKSQMSGGMGFDPPSLIAAARWCLTNNINLNQANDWINRATLPNLGGVKSFQALSVKSGILRKLNLTTEADKTMAEAIESASTIELHQYGRQLLSENKIDEAFAIFEINFKRSNGSWPTNAGMMRGYSAKGNFKKALEHARIALSQSPDDMNKKSIESAIKKLESGKAL